MLKERRDPRGGGLERESYHCVTGQRGRKGERSKINGLSEFRVTRRYVVRVAKSPKQLELER